MYFLCNMVVKFGGFGENVGGNYFRRGKRPSCVKYVIKFGIRLIICFEKMSASCSLLLD